MINISFKRVILFRFVEFLIFFIAIFFFSFVFTNSVFAQYGGEPYGYGQSTYYSQGAYYGGEPYGYGQSTYYSQGAYYGGEPYGYGQSTYYSQGAYYGGEPYGYGQSTYYSQGAYYGGEPYGYGQSTYYSQGAYYGGEPYGYGQSTYYSQGSYGGGYAQSTYYSEGSYGYTQGLYYSQGDYTVPPPPGSPPSVRDFAAPGARQAAQDVLDGGGSQAAAVQAAIDHLANLNFTDVYTTTAPDGSILVVCNNAAVIIVPPDSPGYGQGAYPPVYSQGTYPPLYSQGTYGFYSQGAYVSYSQGAYGEYSIQYLSEPAIPPVPYPGEYPGEFASPPDLSIVPKVGNPTQFTPGQVASFTFTVTNNSATTVPATVGFWSKGYTEGIQPQCDISSQVRGELPFLSIPKIVNLGAGASQDVTFTFDVGAAITSYTAHAFVSYRCIPDEGPVLPAPAINQWLNNDAGQTYNVIPVTAWFEALKGDVGANNSILVSGSYPAGRYTSEYLLAGKPLGSTTNTLRWKLDNYNFPQISADVYTYLRDRFRSKATKEADEVSELDPAPIFNYYNGNVTIGSVVTIPVNNDYIWFIDGNLTINGNVNVPPDSTIVFVVRDNITINTNVTLAEGVYVAGGGFTDVTDAISYRGSRLFVNGAIYAGNVALDRRCDSSCSNTSSPVETITFEPRYIDALNNILGASAISWIEVAP